MRSIFHDYLGPLILGLILGGMFIYAVTHPSTCRWEEHC